MAKKKGDAIGAVASVVTGFLDALVGGVLTNAFDTVKSRTGEIAAHISKVILFTFLILISVVFIVVGAVQLLEAHYAIERGWFYIASAVVLIFWALIVKIQIEKER